MLNYPSILLSLLLYLHPLHVSVTNLDIITDEQKVKFSVRLYYDDFQTLMNALYYVDIDFSNTDSISVAEWDSITDYLQNTFIITSDQYPCSYKLDNWQINDPLIWLYFESDKNFKITGNLFVENRIMLELYGDQKNLLIVNMDGKEKGLEFGIQKMKQQIVF